MATTQRTRTYERSPEGEPEAVTVQPHSQQNDGTVEQLSLLNDAHAREILTVLATGPRGGRALAEACDISRATAYRRLNRLADAGFVTAELCPDPDGHHRKEYHLVRNRLRVEINRGTITVTAATEEK